MAEVIKLLSIPLSELYVLESGDSYEFVHDQVQQAAYGLLDAQDRKSKHLEIGRLLLKGTDELVTSTVAADAAKDVAAAGLPVELKILTAVPKLV